MLIENYKNVCEATKTTQQKYVFDTAYLVFPPPCNCSALYQNDKERPCILPHITNLLEELAPLKAILILNQEP
jgi:hypothetical protein